MDAERVVEYVYLYTCRYLFSFVSHYPRRFLIELRDEWSGEAETQHHVARHLIGDIWERRNPATL